MRENQEIKYVKRTQRDYSYAFKLSVVNQLSRPECIRDSGFHSPIHV